MAEKRLADVVASWYWDERHKRWTVTLRGRGWRAWKRVEVTAPMDQVSGQLMLDAVQREMESWLA